MSLKSFLALKMITHRKGRDLPVEVLESKHTDPDTFAYNDSSYFAGVSRDGFTFVTRQAFRTGKHNENWLKIHIPGEGVWGFEDMELPEGEGFKQGTLEYVCLKPGEEWSIKYDGPVFKDGKEEEIKLNLKWRSTSPVMDFDKEGTSPRQVAEQVASQKWNKEFFRRLREIHLVHIEQGGEITGTITWKGKENGVKLKGVRDHSFGKRNWEEWSRHIWFLGILDDGRFFNVSVIDYDFVKDLKAGFIFDGEKYVTFAETPSFADLNLKEPLPHKLSFKVKEMEKGDEKEITTDMVEFFPFMMDAVYHIRQSKAEFTYGGVKGIGIAEMGVKKSAVSSSQSADREN